MQGLQCIEIIYMFGTGFIGLVKSWSSRHTAESTEAARARMSFAKEDVVILHFMLRAVVDNASC